MTAPTQSDLLLSEQGGPARVHEFDQGTPQTVHFEKQSTKLWLSDGNLILSAPSALRANSTLNMRVHASVLCRHSQVFADMLNIPAGYEASTMEGETYEGLPRVWMTDSAEELEAFLLVLYDPWAFSTKKRVMTYLSHTKCFMKLADKYNLHHMKTLVHNFLEEDWPMSLEMWDLTDSRRDTVLASGIVLREDYLPEPGLAVRLARQYQIKSVLPAALYHLSRSPREKRYKSYIKATGVQSMAVTVATLHGQLFVPVKPSRTLKSIEPKVRWDLVPLDTLAALYKLGEVTEEAGVVIYDAFVRRKANLGAFSGCTVPGCAFIAKATSKFQDLGRDLADRRDILRILRILKSTVRTELMAYRCNANQPCGYHGQKVVERLDAMRLEIWAKLEEFSSLLI